MVGSEASEGRTLGGFYEAGESAVQVYCEFCGRYIRVEHGDDLLVCPECGQPLMWHVVMDLGA